MIKLYSKNVLIEGKLTDAIICINHKKIVELNLQPERDQVEQAIDYQDLVIMEGLIDAHVHINEPGRTNWEGFNSATRAAAKGGITTLIDMPLNSVPVTTNIKSFQSKIESTTDQLHVNCGFWGGLIPENADTIDEILSTGVLGIKAFLTHSGIDEFPNVTEKDLRRAMPVIAKHQSRLLVHCELDSPHEGLGTLRKNPTHYLSYLASRPRSWENNAIRLMVSLAEEYKCPIHIVHLSSSDLLPQLQKWRSDGLPVTIETCPHYLCLSAESIPDGQTIYKCAPPIREAANNDRLWEALGTGLIDFVVTDHSPAPPDLKALDTGDFDNAWGGISGLQHSLSMTWTEAEKRGFHIADLGKWMSENVAKFLGINDRKGKIAVGYDADLVIWDPYEAYVIEKNDLEYRHQHSPYIGRQVKGKVHQTYINGVCCYDQNNLCRLNEGKLILNKT